MIQYTIMQQYNIIQYIIQYNLIKYHKNESDTI